MSDLTLVIGNKNYSSWSLRPWIYMKNKNIAFSEKRVALAKDDTQHLLTPYFSGGKVPVLINGSLTVWDSISIMEYLADRYPDHSGWPENKNARATARSVSAEMHSSFSALRRELPMNCRKTYDNFTLSARVMKDINRITDVWKFCHDHYGQNGPWLFGEFSIADAMYAPVAVRFTGYDVPLEGFAKEYVKTLITNPYMMEWIEAAEQETEVIEAVEITV